jgi:hypothetical protein
VDGVVFHVNAADGDPLAYSFPGYMLILFDSRELPRRMEGFDLGHWNGYVTQNIAVKGHCAGDHTDQLAGELVSIDEDNGIGSIGVDQPRTEKQYAAENSSGNESAEFEHPSRMRLEGTGAGLKLANRNWLGNSLMRRIGMLFTE